MSKVKAKAKTKDVEKQIKQTTKKLDIGDIDISDPLDKKGSKKNFLTGSTYSTDYKDYAEKWSVLPLYENKNEIEAIFQNIANNQVTLVISGTGSGKTVLVPKFLLRYFYAIKEEDKREKTKIVITNPKKLTTIYNAEYSAKTLDVELGAQVGYKFRGSPDNMISDKSNLIYSTDGLLLAQINKGDLLLKDYDGVIIDEAHERQVPIDLLLYFLKHVMKQRPEFKVIIMSATIDAELFRKFYEDDGIKFGLANISGKPNYPIESIYLKENDKINLFNYMDVGLAQILKLLETTVSGDILMFVTSQRETELGCSRLQKLCPERIRVADVCSSYYCAEVFAKMDDDKKALVGEEDKYKSLNPKYTRKVIFATNVAESSITFPGIVYVIDTGLELLGYFNYEKHSQVLEKRYITRAQVKQRMGRAGRTQPGICYHLYTESKYNNLNEFPSPAIALSNLSEHFLAFVKNQKYLSDAIKLAIGLLTPASFKQITSAIRYLHFYNLLKLVDLTKEQSGGKGGKRIKKRIKIGRVNKSCVDKAIDYFLSSNMTDNTVLFGGKSGGADDEAGEISNLDSDSNEETTLMFKDMPYSKLMGNISLYDNYEGTITTFGNIIYELSGYPMEITMLAFYGRLLGLPSLYTIAATIAAMDYKIDNLIKFPPNIQQKDKAAFINENFGNAITYHFSEHMFVYNLISNYYELDNTQNLNKGTYDIMNEIKTSFTKVLDRIKDDTIENINKKYKLIPENINLDELDIIEKIYMCIYLSYRYNTIKLVNNDNMPIFQTQHYFDNTQGTPSFMYGNQIDTTTAQDYPIGICSSIVSLMGKQFMNSCTLLPKSLLQKINLIN